MVWEETRLAFGVVCSCFEWMNRVLPQPPTGRDEKKGEKEEEMIKIKLSSGSSSLAHPVRSPLSRPREHPRPRCASHSAPSPTRSPSLPLPETRAVFCVKIDKSELSSFSCAEGIFPS